MKAKRDSRNSHELLRRLVEAREAEGLKQTELGELLGRPQSFVSNYERGQRRLDVIEFIEIAKALGLDPVAVVRELASGDKKTVAGEDGIDRRRGRGQRVDLRSGDVSGAGVRAGDW